MWGGSLEQLAQQYARENELKTSDQFWAGFLRLGARAERYDGSAECGINLVRDILSRPHVVLDIQRQIVDEGKNLTETAAEFHLRKEMVEAEESFNQQLLKMKADMDGALSKNDLKTAAELTKSSEEPQTKIRRMEMDRSRLEEYLQQQLFQHQLIIQQTASDRRTTLMVIGGVAVGALIAGLGMLAGTALAGATSAAAGAGAITSLTALPAATMVGVLEKRAIMGATQSALRLGTAVFRGGWSSDGCSGDYISCR